MPPDLWLAPLAVLAAYALTAFMPHTDKRLAGLPFNLVLLAHAASFMAQGVRRSEMRAVALGCVLLVALTGARYVEGFLYARGKRLKGGA